MPVRYIPRIPPPALRDWVPTPGGLWGISEYCRCGRLLFVYDCEPGAQIPADIHPRRVQRVERHPSNPHHPQRADGQAFLRVWR